MVLLFEVRYFAVLLLYTFYVFVERPLVISLKQFDDFSLKYLSSSGTVMTEAISNASRGAGLLSLPVSRLLPTRPCFVETRDDIAVQIENEYAPEEGRR